ncbi:hypothetical protein AB0395_44875 [Streptosporangium sp. NPDC051023]|uniref:hypothetical protein n=1 Tax=Streptosporangium sp. NPDC051023 TaxID=3155410 RepID=UPI00344C2795
MTAGRRPWIDKHELARHLGLGDSVSGIHRKAASGEWPSHKVLGQLRFSPEDVAAIEELLVHPATRRRRQVVPTPSKPRRKSQGEAQPPRTGGFADLEPRPIRRYKGKVRPEE